MKTTSIGSLESINSKLAAERKWANGKNFPVDHLHATIAGSRWDYENIFGIYLTNESHAWMALWMAVSNRNTLRKRQLSYRRPTQGNDSLGSVEIYSKTPATELTCDTGYVYLFDPAIYRADRQIVNISEVPKSRKAAALVENGFEWQTIERRGKGMPALVDLSNDPRVVIVDDWQVALTNTANVIPDEELIIERPAIEQLAGRIALTQIEIGEDYLR